MKTSFTKFLVPLLVAVAAILATNACVIHTQPVDSVYAVEGPPSRVYYGGRDLVYRSDGYYYYDGGGWYAAQSVPSYVSSYHRPAYRPSYYRPSYSRPTYVGSTTRPLHVNSSRPTYGRPTTSRPSYGRPTSGPSHSRPVTSRPTTSRPTTSAPSRGPTQVQRPSSAPVRTPHGTRPTEGRRINSR